MNRPEPREPAVTGIEFIIIGVVVVIVTGCVVWHLLDAYTADMKHWFDEMTKGL